MSNQAAKWTQKIHFFHDFVRPCLCLHHRIDPFAKPLICARNLRIVFGTRNQYVLPQTTSSECCSIPSRTSSDTSRGITCLAKCSAVIRRDTTSSICTSAA